MAKLETALSLEQILEGMRQLSDQEKRALAAMVLSDKKNGRWPQWSCQT